MASKLLQKTELLFWDHAIPRMSEDPRIGSLVRNLSKTNISDDPRRLKAFFSFIAVCGLILGILAYFLTQST